MREMLVIHMMFIAVAAPRLTGKVKVNGDVDDYRHYWTFWTLSIITRACQGHYFDVTGANFNTLHTPVETTDTLVLSEDVHPVSNSLGTDMYTVEAEECAARKWDVVRNISSMEGTIIVMNFNENVTDSPQVIIDSSTMVCRLNLSVPTGYTMNITVEDLPQFSCDDVRVEVLEKEPEIFNQLHELRMCFHGTGNQIYTRSNNVQIKVTPRKQGQSGKPWAILHFMATPVSFRYSLPIVYTSSTAGYIASYHSHLKPYARGMSASRDLIFPSEHVIMISFPLQEIESDSSHNDKWSGYQPDKVTVSEIPNGTTYRLPYKWEGTIFTPRVFSSSIRLYFRTLNGFSLGFKMLFSFHPENKAPLMLASGLFGCSVPHYATFKQHLHCNLEPECLGGEDERDCPFYHPGCNGTVGYRNACFTLVAWHVQLTWREAESACKARGGQLARLKTPGERQAAIQIFSYGIRRFPYFIGATKSESLPKAYRNVLIWSDRTVAYDLNVSLSAHRCVYCLPFRQHDCILVDCDEKKLALVIKYFICDFNKMPFQRHPIMLAKPSAMLPQGMIKCSSGHVTRNFLTCETNIQYRMSLSITLYNDDRGSEFPKFLCDNGRNWIHYSLLCDFRKDCLDWSDEKFCVHESNCPDRTCRNSQCFSFDDWCDGMQHCVDSTDERACPEHLPNQGVSQAIPPPVVIDLDGHGNVKYSSLKPSDSCPETHFPCPGDYVYCLPIYVRCNSVYDCPGHEDEVGCQHYTCPGYYRCRESSVCVHPHHVCDGVFQCPQQDDEWMCSRNLTCPKGCHCQGLALICTRPFLVDSYSDLRYLDASGSGLTSRNLTNNFYLVKLVLSYNSLNTEQFSHMPFPNLLYLDVSHNLIRTLNVDVFRDMKNLRWVSISNNPLAYLVGSDTNIRNENLHTMDLSHSRISQFGSKVLSNFPKLTTLNISHSKLHTIDASGFSSLSSLVTLDLQGSPVQNFPKDVFRDLSLLEYIRTDNYKLCCRQTLPRYFKDSQCVAPFDEVSSCEDLLRADVYRVALWVFAALSLTGNSGCLIFRLLIHKTRSKSAFSMFVTNLSVADLIMGVYLATIGVADQVFRNNYLWHETQWKEHVACRIAGFLSMLSSEVSPFIICLITLDRFITLRFPFTVVRFVRRSAIIACSIVWTLGFCLAALPLLPVTSHWMFYSQTGICLPLPFTRKYYDGLGYSFGVMIVLNFILFLLVAAGQVTIYWSVHTNSMAIDTTRKSQDLTIARRLFSVAVSDFLVWFPIGLLGILANRGTPIPGEVNVGVAIFVLPLNSALNPFLYTYNLVMEKIRKAGEARMMLLLQTVVLSRINTPSAIGETSTGPTASYGSTSATRQTSITR